MQQAAFLSDTGEVLAEVGINRATNKANSVSPGWSDRAMAKVQEFIAHWGFNDFTAEEAQLWAYEKGLTHPASNNAWGGVFRRLSNQNVIEKVGIATSKKPEAHGRTILVWRVKPDSTE